MALTSPHPQGIFKGVKTLADPLANLAMPAAGSCTANQYQVKGTQTINPGTYCNGFQVNSGANITMNPGVYIITQDDMQIDSKSTVNGKGVTIVLTGSGGKYPKLNINNDAKVNLSAPTSGTYKGILFFGDRKASNLTHVLEGGTNMILDGMIYTPSADIKFGDNSTSTGTFGTQVIAKSYEGIGIGNLGGDGSGGQSTGAGQSIISQ